MRWESGRRRCWLLVAALTVGALAPSAVPPASAAGGSPPVGTFSAGPKSQLLTNVEGVPPYAYAEIAVISLSDDTSPVESLTLTLDAGKNAEGTGARRVFAKVGGGITRGWWVEYQAAGVYQPTVLITDDDGNTTTVALDTVTVLQDSTAPVVRIAVPARKRDSAAAWRSLRGRAADQQMPIWAVTAVVQQRRGGIWRVYDAPHQRWVRLPGNRPGTVAALRARYGLRTRDVRENTWILGPVRGVTLGLLLVQSQAVDVGGSTGESPAVRQQIRRR